MLVLARQLNERIVLPTVGATIEVVAIKPGGVRLGIEAPPEVTILREEVYRRGCRPPHPALSPGGRGLGEGGPPPPAGDAEDRLARVKHVLRNRLHTLTVGLTLLRQQLQASSVPGLDAMLARMEDEVRSLDQQLKEALSDPLPERPAPRVVVAAPCLEDSEHGFAI